MLLPLTLHGVSADTLLGDNAFTEPAETEMDTASSVVKGSSTGMPSIKDGSTPESNATVSTISTSMQGGVGIAANNKVGIVTTYQQLPARSNLIARGDIASIDRLNNTVTIINEGTGRSTVHSITDTTMLGGLADGDSVQIFSM